MSYRESDNRGWNPTNRQPGKELKGIFGFRRKDIKECPHFTLIKICALLAEVDPYKDEFCGQKTERVDNIKPLSGFRGTIYHPQAMCAEVHDKLEGMVTFVQKEIPPIDKSKLDELLISEKPNEEKERVLKEYNQAVEKQEEQRRILELWRNVIFETCCLHASDNIGTEETHFRRVESPANLSKEEVMKKINFFLAGLKNQVTGETYFDRTAEHCPQAPKSDEIGMRSIL